MGTLESACDDIIVAAVESTGTDDESDYQSDNFSETGCTDMKTLLLRVPVYAVLKVHRFYFRRIVRR